MKTRRPAALIRVLTVGMWLLTVSTLRADSILVDAFDTPAETTNWGNWFGTAFFDLHWDSSDASSNPASGSMEIEALYPDAGLLFSCCGPQFVVTNGINGPIYGNPGGPEGFNFATNIQFDVRFDPTSAIREGTNWPTIEVGTSANNFGQYNFGTFTFPTNQTGWVRINIPIGPNQHWTNIPNIYFKYFTASQTGWLRFFVDNISFTLLPEPFLGPRMGIAKPVPGLRIFSSPSQYSRSQLVSVDTNQSWVGGSYPVSYSFTISAYDNVPALNEFHLFLIPLNSDQDGIINQYTDYITASNSVRLQIVGMGAGSNPVVANLAWKTNMVNSNPVHTELNITNSTAIGTWTLTFTSASAGTLTPPGSTAVPFTITDPTVSADFSNPMCVFFGLQPNLPTTVGQHADFTHFQTVNVSSPGIPINSDFTTGILDTNIWSTAATAQVNAMAMVPPNAAYWLNWTFPDYNLVLATSPTLDGSVPWRTPFWYTGYNSNTPVYQFNASGGRVWSLILPAALPTVDGTSNGVPSTSAFFRLIFPGPSE